MEKDIQKVNPMPLEQINLNEMQVGKIGEYLVCADLIKHGYTAYPSEQGLSYDVVLDISSRLIRVQVKTASKANYSSSKNKYPIYAFRITQIGRGGKKKPSMKTADLYAFVVLDPLKISYLTTKDVLKNAKNTFRSLEFKGKYYDEIVSHKGDEINELFQNGLTCTEISRKLNLKFSGVYAFIHNPRKQIHRNKIYIEELTIEKALGNLL